MPSLHSYLDKIGEFYKINKSSFIFNSLEQDYIYVLVRGMVEVVRYNRLTKKSISFYRIEALTGERKILNPYILYPLSSTGISLDYWSLSKCTFLRLRKAFIKDKLPEEFKSDLFCWFNYQLAQVNAKLSEYVYLTTLSAKHKVFHKILSYTKHYNSSIIKVNRTELARELNLSRECVSKTIALLLKEGYIYQMDYTKIKLNHSKLK